MNEYEVIAYYSESVRVKAENENEAINKAKEQLRNINTMPIADNFEVEVVEEFTED